MLLGRCICNSTEINRPIEYDQQIQSIQYKPKFVVTFKTVTTHKSTLFIILLAFAFQLPAQQPTIKTFTAQDGLVTNQVRKIYQDSKGFIWIGTMEGISQFNGHQFINYSIATGLPNSVVNDFIEIDGKMLVALGGGYICTIQNGEISSIAQTPSPVIDFSSFLKLPDGRLLISTSGSGIYEYRNGRILKPKQVVSDLHADFITYSMIRYWQVL